MKSMTKSTTPSTMTTAVSNKTNPNTPPGYNKGKRDQSKFLLVITAFMLVTGAALPAIVTSAMAVLCIKDGTLASTRNMKWMTLSFVSFASSLSSFILDKSHSFVDEDRAYGLKVTLHLGAKAIQIGWGATLALFLVSAFHMSNNEEKHEEKRQ